MLCSIGFCVVDPDRPIYLDLELDSRSMADEKPAVMATATPFVKHNVLQSFNGEGDVIAWLQKAELVARLTKVTDVASFVPLYLEGGALAVYLEMDGGEQGDFEMIKRRLKEAFTDNEFMSYCKLREARWTGEPVDVFANDLRRLARTCGFEGAGLEKVVTLAFVTGFPEGVATELQQVVGVQPKIGVPELVGRSRILTANKGGVGLSAPALTAGNGSGGRKTGKGCFLCGGGHLMRDCPNQGETAGGRKRSIICFRCGAEGHIASRCNQEPKGKPKGGRGSEGVSAGAATEVAGVPVISVTVNGRICRALVDTGCSNTMVRAGLVSAWWGEVCTKAFDGRLVKGKGTTNVELVVDGEKVATKATVVDHLVGSVDVVIGMDVIRKLGGVTVGHSKVEFGEGVACASIESSKRQSLTVEDKDFEATFDGQVWTVRYYWKEGRAPSLKNRVSLYNPKMEPEMLAKFEEEVDRWIDEGILIPWHEEVIEGILPLMAVEQASKNKVRPVLDFREANESVECHTGDEIIDACDDVLRQWRRVSGETEIVDLKSAYLQLRVSPELWKYQLVKYKDRTYCLTRLGFGLNCAPRVMTKVLKTVLAQSDDVRRSTSSYIDDILVDVSQVKSDDVILHLERYGLVAKPAEKLDGGSALGLKLSRGPTGKLWFGRGGELPTVDHRLTKRELFATCGKLAAHYPVAGWLRVACSYVKRHSGVQKWDDYIDERAQMMIIEIVQRVSEDDPVQGEWKVGQNTSGVVWCDASDLCEGVLLEIDGVTVEDAAWLRKSDDFHHINVAELNAVLKGVNLGVKWGLKEILILTDSVTVGRWIDLTLSEERRIKTSGAAEILVKRRLAALKDMVEELGLRLQVKCVPSKDNKADALTRVRKVWRESVKSSHRERLGCAAVELSARELHEQHHFGVERSWYLARLVNPNVTKEEMRAVVRSCGQCQSIDPSPVKHVGGELGISKNWERLALDVTHYRGVPYLTMVDCGPGRFVIWRRLKNERADQIVSEMAQVFYERGPVKQVLMDNGASFRSETLLNFLREWNVLPFFRAAYRPGGNGIVERNHRTIKAIAERGDMSPLRAVFFYNRSPRYGQEESSVPQRSVMTYEWRLPMVPPEESSEEPTTRVSVGDEVWVKPADARCTSRWARGTVTKVNSASNVEVDHMPRHVLDIRSVEGFDQSVPEQDEVQDEGQDNRETERRYPGRARQAPVWHGDYEM